MKKRLNMRHAMGAVALGALFTFQNCSDPAQDASSNEAASYMKDLPFAYKASLDTMAYMSCSRMASTYERRAFFTFRAGAFTPIAGLSVNEAFTEATKYYSLENKRAAFGDSAANANTRLQLALRSTTNFQSVFSKDQAPADGKSLGTMMTSLSAEPIVNHLATMVPGDIKHYFASGENDRLMATSLRFNDGDESVAADIRMKMDNNEAILALGFTNTDSNMEPYIRGPAGVTVDQAYGVGYKIMFGSPANWLSAERRVIQSVSEVSLQAGLPADSQAQWTCPSSMQFVMVRTEDIALVSPCNRTVDSYTTESQRQALEAIRRVLPVEDFYVDVVNRCIVAKPHISTQTCYGSRSGRGPIDYSSGSCTADSCPHYVSVCVKLK